MAPLQRILHVDDDPDIREITRLALEAIGGMTVHQCADGHEALAAIEPFDPQLLLLDYMMPGMTGLDVLAALRAAPRCRDLPAVFMTAKAESALSEQLLAAGAASVLTKPFDPMRLADDLRDVWHDLNPA